MDITAAIRTAHAQLGGDIVSLADIRDALPAGWDRADVDAALRVYHRQPGVTLLPESNQKALDARTRAAAVVVGDQSRHLLSITTTPVTAPAPAKPATTAAATVEDIAQQLATLADTEQAAALVATLTGRQITAVARITGAAVPSSGRVADRQRALIQPVAMRARTQAITNGCRRGSYNPAVSVFTG